MATLIHGFRRELLPSLHAFEPGRSESERNWTLLRERVLKRLGRRVLEASSDGAASNE